MTSDPLFIETIRLADGMFHNLPLHRRRMELTCREAFGSAAPPLPLDARSLDAKLRSGIFKCRITYARRIHNVEFEPYTPHPPRSLRLVECDDIDYHLKFADRSHLNRLKALADGYDDILIVRNGLLTDISYANILLHSPQGLLTPALPLLNGVMRQHLLAQGDVRSAHLSPADLLPGNRLGIYAISIINAMLPPDAVSPIPLSAISTEISIFRNL